MERVGNDSEQGSNEVRIESGNLTCEVIGAILSCMKRLYSLFERKGEKWQRISGIALEKEKAIRLFQGALLRHYLSGDCGVRELRPVQISRLEGR